MRKLLASTALAGVLLASPALADGFYIGGETGYGWSGDSGIDRETKFDTRLPALFSFGLNDSL